MVDILKFMACNYWLVVSKIIRLSFQQNYQIVISALKLLSNETKRCLFNLHGNPCIKYNYFEILNSFNFTLQDYLVVLFSLKKNNQIVLFETNWSQFKLRVIT